MTNLPTPVDASSAISGNLETAASQSSEADRQVSVRFSRGSGALLACCAFLGGSLLSLLGVQLAQNANARGGSDGGRQAAGDVMQMSERFEWVARQVSPAVVYVEAAKPARNGKNQPLEESGSGVIVRWPGQPTPLVITNNHVIAQATPDHITVNLSNGRLLKPNRVWTDPESDVAVLRIDWGGEMPTAVLGDSNQVQVGQWVLAFGSPFGLNQTVTHGIISARERGQVSLGSTIRIKDFLQTDAAINPGSSGGPLVDLRGEVIGINTAIASHSGSNSGVAFSIPANLVRRMVTQLLEKGSVSRGYLGIQMMQRVRTCRCPASRARSRTRRLDRGRLPGHASRRSGVARSRRDLAGRCRVDSQRESLHQLHQHASRGPAYPAASVARRQAPNLAAVVGDWTRSRNRFKPENER